ncbi:unnamed protein product [Ilex paraguariensis]|uniref:Uncharacterized protein n=1 Tax=Ilex paraguariensis TaxID=185542 RepID=A0ABC8RGQ0_9AQUA
MNDNKDNFNMSDIGSASNAEDEANIVDALKMSCFSFGLGYDFVSNKLQDLTEKHSRKVIKRVKILRKIQACHFYDSYALCIENIMNWKPNICEERTSVEAKYQKLFQRLYSKRYETVNGFVEAAGGKENLISGLLQ